MSTFELEELEQQIKEQEKIANVRIKLNNRIEEDKQLYITYPLEKELKSDNMNIQYFENLDIDDIKNKKIKNTLIISILYASPDDKIREGIIVDKIRIKSFKDMNKIKISIIDNLTKQNFIKRINEIVNYVKAYQHIDTIIFTYSGHGYYGKQNQMSGMDLLDGEKIDIAEFLPKFKFIKNLMLIFDACNVPTNSSNINYENIFDDKQNIFILNSSEIGKTTDGSSKIGGHLLYSFIKSITILEVNKEIDLFDFAEIIINCMINYKRNIENKNYKLTILLSKRVEKYIKVLDKEVIDDYLKQGNYYIDEVNKKAEKNKKIVEENPTDVSNYNNNNEEIRILTNDLNAIMREYKRYNEKLNDTYKLYNNIDIFNEDIINKDEKYYNISRDFDDSSYELKTKKSKLNLVEKSYTILFENNNIIEKSEQARQTILDNIPLEYKNDPLYFSKDILYSYIKNVKKIIPTEEKLLKYKYEILIDHLKEIGFDISLFDKYNVKMETDIMNKLLEKIKEDIKKIELYQSICDKKIVKYKNKINSLEEQNKIIEERYKGGGRINFANLKEAKRK